MQVVRAVTPLSVQLPPPTVVEAVGQARVLLLLV